VLVHAANELSNGHLEYEIKYQSKDEMGFLSTTMEMMRKSILKRIQQIHSLQDELIQKEKLASIGSVASAINHEIRNQLSFGMAAELIRQKHPNDEQVLTYTQMILDARDYILRMLDDIRNFARANQKVEYSREAKSLKETLERTIAFCRFDKELKHVEINEDYADVGEVMCDHQRIGQVVINLIRNGGHAMEKEGELDIRLHMKENWVVIEVEDHGCGIPKENLEKIWESFFSTKGEKGLGLGLDICKKIIEDHEGKIYCESEVGKGTTFFVELPMNVSA
jgi:signal transduction histidine kinase